MFNVLPKKFKYNYLDWAKVVTSNVIPPSGHQVQF